MTGWKIWEAGVDVDSKRMDMQWKDVDMGGMEGEIEMETTIIVNVDSKGLCKGKDV